MSDTAEGKLNPTLSSTNSTASLDEASVDYTQRKQWEDNANAYIKNCKRFEIQIDPNVVAALLTGWRVLQPTKDKFKEGGLLPLMGLLDDNQHVHKLNLSSSGMNDPRYRSAGNGDSNARILAQILRVNKSIQDVDLSNTGLNDDGMAEICAALRVNKSVTSLNLSMNHFGEQGAKDAGKWRLEGKEYVLRDGDVVHFRFNV